MVELKVLVKVFSLDANALYVCFFLLQSFHTSVKNAGSSPGTSGF